MPRHSRSAQCTHLQYSSTQASVNLCRFHYHLLKHDFSVCSACFQTHAMSPTLMWHWSCSAQSSAPFSNWFLHHVSLTCFWKRDHVSPHIPPLLEWIVPWCEAGMSSPCPHHPLLHDRTQNWTQRQSYEWNLKPLSLFHVVYLLSSCVLFGITYNVSREEAVSLIHFGSSYIF